MEFSASIMIRRTLPLLTIISSTLGRVEIVNPYYPLYVKSGSTLTVVCQSADRTDINWVQQTPQTNWVDAAIEPVNGGDFTIQSCTDEPTGFSKSTLLRTNMSLNARGMYLCKDSIGSSSYAIWVTIIYVGARIVESSADKLVLGCSISGFDSNLPSIDYDWYWNDALIPHPHEHLAVAVAVHSRNELIANPKYSVTFEGNELRLIVNRPTVADGGQYNCSFTLSTNLGRRIFLESITVADHLLPSAASHFQCPCNVYFLSIVGLCLWTLLINS